MLGVVTYDDVLDAMEDIADETIANMAGTAEKVSEHEPLLKRFFSRAPWLVVTLCAGLINVGVMSSFQNYAGGVLTFVMFFVPLITGMSGNIGILIPRLCQLIKRRYYGQPCCEVAVPHFGKRYP